MSDELRVDRTNLGSIPRVRIRANGASLILGVDEADLIFSLVRSHRTHDYGTFGYHHETRTMRREESSVKLSDQQLEELIRLISDPVQYAQLMRIDAGLPPTSQAETISNPNKYL